MMIASQENYSGGGGGQRPIRLVQITDTHFSADQHGELDGVNTRESLHAVLAHVRRNAWPVDAVLATGDLSHDGSGESYAALRECLLNLGAPVYCIPGNHDDPPVMRQALPAGTVQFTEAAAVSAWQLLFLNTHLPGCEGGRLGPERLGRFEALLADCGGRPTLVCLHHHPVSIGSPWMDRMMLADAGEFLAVLDRHPQVRAVVWGHIHQEFVSRRRGVWLLGTPSTCVQFRPRATRYERDDRGAGYRHFTLRPDGSIETAIRRVGDGVSSPAGCY